MNKNLKKSLLTALLLCSSFSAAWADGWKLTNTTVYGAGGYWENGQKTRIDCSFKNGTFQYERKVSVGNNMDVYSSKAEFSEPKQVYAAGEDISVRIGFSQKGERSGYTPYARVTVMPQTPNWTKGKGVSNKIPATGKVDGQATDAGGRNTVTPPETVTLMAQACTGGSQMAIVYSCNGMDVVYLYDWDGEVVSMPAAATETPTDEVTNTVFEDDPETQPLQEPEHTEELTIEDDDFGPIIEDTRSPADESDLSTDEPQPILKYVIVGGVALLLIALILFLFRKKKDKTSDEAEYQPQGEQPMEENKARVCPNCGAPITEGERFCGECGHQLM